MDFLTIFYISILLGSVLLIITTFVTLPNVGDERKKMIKTQAQSFSFTVIIMMLLIEAGRDIYSILWGTVPYEPKPAFALLTGAALIYLVSLLFYRRKYGN